MSGPPCTRTKSLPSRVLIFGHSYYAQENRKQLTAVARHLGSSLDVAMPEFHSGDGLFHYSAEQLPSGGPGYTFHVLKPWPTSDHLRALLPRLKRTLDRVGPQLVHCEWAPYTMPALQLALTKRLGSREFLLTGLVRQPVVNFTDRFYGSLLARFSSSLLAELDALQTTSELAERAIVEALNLDVASLPRRFRLYQTGVDTDLFRPPGSNQRGEIRGDLGFREGESVVGYCGRFEERKGLSSLLEAAARLREVETGLSDVRLALLGAGPLEDEIRKRAKERRVPLSIFSVRPHAEVAAFLQGLDVFVLPSQVREDWIEHDAHAAAEALACGLPVIGTDAGATPEVLGDAGLLVPPGESEALSEAMERVLTDPTTAGSLGSKGRDRAITHFSHEAVARGLVDAWRGVMEARA